MPFTVTREQRVDEGQIDGVLDCGEAFARFDAAYIEMRQTVARHLGGARYVSDGSAARAIVAAEGRRGR